MPKKPHVSVATGTATCSVSPDPCPVGGLFTVTATGVVIVNYLNVFVYDSHGVNSIACSYDSVAGTVTGSSYASWAGVSSVEVRDYDTQTGSVVIVATCTFTVT